MLFNREQCYKKEDARKFAKGKWDLTKYGHSEISPMKSLAEYTVSLPYVHTSQAMQLIILELLAKMWSLYYNIW